MNKKELIGTLETLHEELQGASTVDADTQALLVTLVQDIHRLMQPSRDDPTRDDPTQEVEDLTAQVQDLMLKFETDHPQLTRALNQVSSALANLGI
jgi:hypothetical protein